MDQNTVILPGFIIADLYKNALVEITSINDVSTSDNDNTMEVLQPATPLSNISIAFLGGNNQNVIVVINNPADEFLNEENALFLNKLLKACGLEGDDIAIVNICTQAVTFHALKEELAAKVILLFGVETADVKLPFDIPLFQVQQYAGCTIISAPTLNELHLETHEAKLKKRDLWKSLQRCFNLG